MNFLRTLLIVFFSKCTVLHSHQQCSSVPTSQHLPWHLLFPVFFFNSGHSKGIRWHFIVVLICISLVISDSEHLFMFVCSLYIFFSEMSVEVLCPFLDFTVELYKSSIPFGYWSFVRYMVWKYFLLFCSLFALLAISFAAQKF